MRCPSGNRHRAGVAGRTAPLLRSPVELSFEVSANWDRARVCGPVRSGSTARTRLSAPTRGPRIATRMGPESDEQRDHSLHPRRARSRCLVRLLPALGHPTTPALLRRNAVVRVPATSIGSARSVVRLGIQQRHSIPQDRLSAKRAPDRSRRENHPDLEPFGSRVADQPVRIFAFCVWNSASVSIPSFLSSPSFCNCPNMSTVDNNAAVGMIIHAMR